MWTNVYLNYRGPLPMISNTAGGVQPNHSFDEAEYGSQYRRAAFWLYCVTRVFLQALR